MIIRNQTEADSLAIGQLVTQAFRLLAQSTGTEAAIIEDLRAANGLILSLVAEDNGRIVGYLAASEAQIGNGAPWSLIGPLAVLPARHGQGIGSALMLDAISRLRTVSNGVALVGDPRYYGRFGFRAFGALWVPGCPPEVVLALPFDGQEPCGELIHHPAFGLRQQQQQQQQQQQ